MKKVLFFLIALVTLINFDVYAEEKNGMIKEGNNYYYYVQGIMQKGLTKIDEDYYFLGENTGRVVKGWVTSSRDGKTYYSNSDGKLVKGFQKIGGTNYYFSEEDRSMQKGLTKVGEDHYFLGENTGRVVTGLVTSSKDGKTYYSNSDGKLVKGFQKVDGTNYYFSEEDRSMQKGLTKVGEDYYFLGENTGRVVTGLVTSSKDGKTYYSNLDGKLVKGFQKVDGTNYYFSEEDRSMQKGLTKVGEDYYFLGENTGRVITGLVTSSKDGKTYYSNSDGKLVKGFQKVDGTNYYFSEEDKSMQKGLTKVGEDYYFLGENTGRVVTGWVTSSRDGRTYYSDTDGKLKAGLNMINNTEYYFSEEDRSLYTGFKKIENNTYYFKKGIKQKGKIKVGNNDYLFDTDGKLEYGWNTLGEDIYYSNYDGVILKGINKIDEDYYFLGENTGRLVKGWVTSSINGKIYYSNTDGKLIKGNQIIDGNGYKFSDDYSLETGWQTLSDGHTYYFYSDGTKAKYICKIAGKRYEFDGNGRLQYSDIKLIADVSSHNGKIDWDTLWNSGEIDGVILRIAAGAVNEDVMLNEYISNVKRLGIPYGVYIYSYAENYDEGKIFADFTSFTMKKYDMNPTLGVYLDLESNIITKYMGPKHYESVVKGFLDTLPFSKIYTYTNYANTALNSDYILQFIDWIANYAVTDRPGNYNKWQYTSKGKLPGINGNVDLSIFYN